MKRFIYLTVALICPFLVMSQSFKFNTTEESVEGMLELDAYGDINVNIDNISGESLFLGWEVTDRKENVAWDLSLCDLGNCHAGVPQSGVMVECESTDRAFLKLTINPNGVEDLCHYTFKVFDVNNKDDFQMITLIANAGSDGTTSISDARAAGIQIYPNPTADLLTVTAVANASNISLFDLKGNSVLSYDCVGKENHQLDLTGLASGMYMVTVKTEKDYIRLPVVRN